MSRVKITVLEIVVVLAMLAVLFLVALPMLERQKETRRRRSCQGNLHRIATAFSMYEKESRGGLWPSLRRCAGSDCSSNVGTDQLWVPDMPALYPAYLPDVSLFVCPSDILDPLRRGMWTTDGQPGGEVVPCQIGSTSYTYLPWAISPDQYLKDPDDINTRRPLDDVLASGFVDAMTEAVQQMTAACESGDFAVFDRDITMGETVIERLSADMALGLPVLYDNVGGSGVPGLISSDLPGGSYMEIVMFNHMGGSNVLYKDGHVEFVLYQSQWPICSSWARTLSMLTETK